MIQLYAVKIDHPLDQSKFKQLIQFTSKKKQARLNRLFHFEEAQRVLIADILSRYAIYKNTKIDLKKIVFVENDYGKPFLKNNHDLHFNLSHSGEWVVCAVHNQPVGIDVEQVKKTELEIARRFFTKKEYQTLLAKNGWQQLDYFYQLWTLKESYVKAIGRGLTIALNSFSLAIINGQITLETKNNLENYFFKQYHLAANYRTAVCATKNEFPANIKIITVTDLYDEILNQINRR